MQLHQEGDGQKMEVRTAAAAAAHPLHFFRLSRRRAMRIHPQRADRCGPSHARSPTWHVVVGSNYGSHVVHATKNFIYFYIGPKAILIFKSG